jgi:hypothetical protein
MNWNDKKTARKCSNQWKSFDTKCSELLTLGINPLWMFWWADDHSIRNQESLKMVGSTQINNF